MVSEAETALILKRAMRRYSYNNLSESNLGIFKGVGENGVPLLVKLKGINLQFFPFEPVNVAEKDLQIESQKKYIANLKETVKKQAETIKSLKKKAEKPKETDSPTKIAPDIKPAYPEFTDEKGFPVEEKTKRRRKPT